ncbi:ANTAR domain-containing protein [Gordonia sp. CPCC 205333]|uniref:ANTAR domain-containing protein n=1 Tax=Gordonia sp. CPCC 205333 TaxID=3140790 RepID=UPI003AF36BBA
MTNGRDSIMADSTLPRTVSVGRFWYYFDDDRWVWSDELAQMHGYQNADAVDPTTSLLLRHKHPEDKARVEELITRVRDARAPFSGQHRIVHLSGKVVPVVVVADTIDGGAGTSGFYIALSDHRPSPTASTPEVRRSVEQRVSEVVEDRAAIEQAKGALRVIYQLDDEQAFDLLTWRSQETNTKLRELAAALVDQLASTSVSPEARARFDHVLLTVHEHTDQPASG